MGLHDDRKAGAIRWASYSIFQAKFRTPIGVPKEASEMIWLLKYILILNRNEEGSLGERRYKRWTKSDRCSRKS